jgi:hypothetical protein
MHPAVTHAIVNSPNPGCFTTRFPDGSAANLILLGDPIPITQTGDEAWWPTAISPEVRSKMMRRFLREGHVLPIVTSICIALLAEIYTNTSGPASDSSEGRVRLGYSSSPVADFGIAKGSADVKNQDKFAYLSLSDMTFSKGQDPDDHYWIYFTTVKGGDVILDCAMFTFNFGMIVPADIYRHQSLPPFSWAPAFFRDPQLARNSPELQTEKQRFSVLRNSELHSAIEHSMSHGCGIDEKTIGAFMEMVAGRKCTELEKNLVMKYTYANCFALRSTLQEKKWKAWPKTPTIAVEADPGEMADYADVEDWWKYMKKWNRKLKQGKITREAFGNAFHAWQNRANKLPK